MSTSMSWRELLKLFHEADCKSLQQFSCEAHLRRDKLEARIAFLEREWVEASSTFGLMLAKLAEEEQIRKAVMGQVRDEIARYSEGFGKRPRDE